MVTRGAKLALGEASYRSVRADGAFSLRERSDDRAGCRLSSSFRIDVHASRTLITFRAYRTSGVICFVRSGTTRNRGMVSIADVAFRTLEATTRALVMLVRC